MNMIIKYFIHNQLVVLCNHTSSATINGKELMKDEQPKFDRQDTMIWSIGNIKKCSQIKHFSSKFFSFFVELQTE